jgi:predicted TIM-barrel fold metal-dependent hydrolase
MANSTPYQNPNPQLQTAKPSITLPKNATDCHCHLFDDLSKYPMMDQPAYLPPPVTIHDYLKVIDTIGIERAVIVHANVYGLDNSLALDVIASAPNRFRAIGLMDESITDAELERLHHGGVRGFRCNLVNQIGLSLDGAKRLGERVKQYNWHTQFLLDVEKVPNLTELFASFPIDVVIDHMGRPIIEQGTQAPGFQGLINFLKTGKAWSKLSAPYRTSKDPIHYRDIIPFAQALVKSAPDRLVWGFDWPHVNMARGTLMPADAELTNQIGQWIESPQDLQMIMVDNPNKLYGF